VGEALLTAVGPRSEAAAQAYGLGAAAHRPSPLPERPWVQGQTWRDVLFAHWALPVEALRAVVPERLPIDTYDGRAWLGVIPFEVSGLRPRGLLPLPWLSRFLETNVRTYTTLDGRPGVHFFSLDAASALAVAGARLTYHLPYFRAEMRIERTAGRISYGTRRRGDRAVELEAEYRPTGTPFTARPGTLEHFLTERYCLYTLARGRILRADIHHPPWPLQPAEACLDRNTMTAPLGIELPGEPALAHFAARQDVVIWAPKRIG
jgi:uncharacterized protein YqjF (DUF2071 family)